MKKQLLLSLGVLLLAGPIGVSAAFQQDLLLPDADGDVRTGTGTMMESTGATLETQKEEASDAPDVKKTLSINIGEADELTRAQFTAIVVNELYTEVELERCYRDIASSLPPRFTLVFADVHVDDPYARHICVAMRDGLIKGYADGFFRPERKINLAEAAKIISRGFVLAPYAETERSGPWYAPHLYGLSVRGALPMNLKTVDQLLTVGDVNEMVSRIANNTTWLPSRTFDELMPRPAPRPAARSAASGPKKPTAASTSSKKTTSAQTSSAISKITSATVSSIKSATSKRALWNPF